jgi:hypothetical protein
LVSADRVVRRRLARNGQKTFCVGCFCFSFEELAGEDRKHAAGACGLVDGPEPTSIQQCASRWAAVKGLDDGIGSTFCREQRASLADIRTCIAGGWKTLEARVQR